MYIQFFLIIEATSISLPGFQTRSKTANRGLELLIYSKDKEPLTRVPMKSISGQQDNPIEMSGERQDNKGLVTLKFLGKYEATFSVTEPEE